MKKRIISLFVVLSMLSAFISIPTVSFAAPDVNGNGVKIAKLELNPGTTYTYTAYLDVWTDTCASNNVDDYFTMQMFSHNFLQSQVDNGETVETSVEDYLANELATDGTDLVGTFVDDANTIYSETLTRDYVRYEAGDRPDDHIVQYKATFTMSNAALASENTTFYIIHYNTDVNDRAVDSFTIKPDGSVAVPCATVKVNYNNDGATASKEIELSGAALKSYTPSELAGLVGGGTPTYEGHKFLGWTTGAVSGVVGSEETFDTSTLQGLTDPQVNQTYNVLLYGRQRRHLRLMTLSLIRITRITQAQILLQLFRRSLLQQARSEMSHLLNMTARLLQRLQRHTLLHLMLLSQLTTRRQQVFRFLLSQSTRLTGIQSAQQTWL